MADAITVVGLKEFGSDVAELDVDLPKTVRAALVDTAELVAADASSAFPVMRGRAAASVSSKTVGNMAAVAMGGSRAPHAFWLNHGGAVGRNNSIKRAYTQKGRYVVPAYERLSSSGAIDDVMGSVLTDSARRAGIEVD